MYNITLDCIKTMTCKWQHDSNLKALSLVSNSLTSQIITIHIGLLFIKEDDQRAMGLPSPVVTLKSIFFFLFF